MDGGPCNFRRSLAGNAIRVMANLLSAKYRGHRPFRYTL